MVERVWIDVGGSAGLQGAVFRYGVLERLGRIARGHAVSVLAWGFAADGMRVVLEGDAEAISAVLRGLLAGTTRSARHAGLPVALLAPVRAQTDDLCTAVVWAHVAPVQRTGRDPLASPWSSHRDLLGFRLGGIVDLARLEGRVDPRAVHARLGGIELPAGWPPPVSERVNLTRLLRVAAGVLSVLPADRRCFRLFVHLARHQGWQSGEIAHALHLSTRRVRQMTVEPEPNLPLARLALGTPCLAEMP